MQKRHYLPTIFFLFLTFVLAGCQNQVDNVTQVKNDVAAITTKVKTQKELMTKLADETEKLPAVYTKEVKARPDDNLLKETDSKLYKLYDQRQKDYASFTTNQNEIATIEKRLTQASKQENLKISTENLKNLLQSLKIAALDYTTLDNFIKETVKAENTVYSSKLSGSELTNSVGRLNQYYGAINQQFEIMDVNLSSVAYHAGTVTKSMK